MHYKAIVLISAFFLFSSSFIAPGKKTNTRIYKDILKDVEKHGQAFSNLKNVTHTIGHRLTGSKNGSEAEAFALNLFKEYGYTNAQFLPFEVKSWSRNKVTLDIVPDNSDNFREVKVVSLAHSPLSANLSAPIVDCKDGLESDFAKVQDDLKGKFALFNVDVQSPENKGKKNLHRSEKTAFAIQHGAAGVILVNKVKGNVLLTGTASVTGELIDIPAVCISYESGRAIRNWIKDEKHILAQVDMLNYYRPVRPRNVSATYPGQKKYENEKIVIGAHLDSWDLAQGAVDNGLGAFSVIDIARVFKTLKLKTKRPIEFVLFMGEEQGLLGSKQYVNQAKASGEIDKIALMVNLDMLNNCKGFNTFGDSDLADIAQRVGNDIKSVDPDFKNQHTSHAGLHSDHQPFMLNGIPICSPNGELSQKAIDCYHADCDSFDLINESEINKNVKYTAMLLYALANADKLPKRKSDFEIRDYLIAQNLKKELIIGKDWRWAE